MRAVLVATLQTFFIALSPTVLLAAAGGNMGGPAPGGLGGGADLNEVFQEGARQIAAGDCKQAESSFKKILGAVSKNPEANYMRGVALQCQEKHKAATRYLRKARRYDKKLYSAYQMLGVSYLELGEREDAQEQLDDLDRLFEACDGSCPRELARARSQLNQAIARSDPDPDPDAEVFTPEQVAPQSRLDGPSPGVGSQVAYLAAVGLINAREYATAIDAFRQLTLTLGPHPDVLNYLGYAHRRLGLYEDARNYYEQALAIDPLHRGANEYLGEMWVDLGKMAAARARLQTLDQACPFGCPEYDDLERRIASRLAKSH
jgi:tetratricopeptide (TPR) repeat protein